MKKLFPILSAAVGSEHCIAKTDILRSCIASYRTKLLHRLSVQWNLAIV